MNCCAPIYMTEISKEEFTDMTQTLNALRDHWSNGILFRDARSYAALAFWDEDNNKFYKAKAGEDPLA